MDEQTAHDLLPEYLLGTLDPDRTAGVENALAVSPSLRREADTLGRALFAVPEELEPEPVPDTAWARLRAAVHEDHFDRAAAASGPGAYPRDARGDDARAGEVRAGEARAGEARGGRAGKPAVAPPSHWRGRIASVALAAALVLLVTVGAWGMQAAQTRAQLANEQRIIAYWMRNPNLRIVSLDGVGPGAVSAGQERADVPPGIVCVLPDGRAMLLQPYAAPRGSRYVLYGVTPEGPVPLGSTPDRFLLFDADELVGIRLTLEGRRDVLVAEARF